MKQIPIFILAATTAVIVAGMWTPTSAGSDHENDAILGGKIPPDYRGWKLISVAHEEGNLNDIRAVLGTDLAFNAARGGILPYPDGAIVARLAWRYLSSEENNAVFGRSQSFVAGPPSNVQFMVKDAKQYASTGGWGFAQFEDGKSVHVVVQDCYACHVPVKSRDFIFTRYAP